MRGGNGNTGNNDFSERDAMPCRCKIAVLGAVTLLALLLCPDGFAAEAPLLDYGVDLVSDYVARGEDIYVRRFDKGRQEHTAVNVAPALQPSVTLHGQSGMSLNVWGSFALTDREDDNRRGFLGLGRSDELDFTLAFDWSNRLGAFVAGFIYYAYADSCYGAATPCNRSTPAPAAVSPEAFLKWNPPFATAVGGQFAYYTTTVPGGWYATLGVQGGERLIWAADVGAVGAGIKDVTGKIGWSFGDVSLSASAAYRPNPEVVGPYAKDGSYLVKGETKKYPATIYWLTVSYAGNIAAN
jgi:hypothetical protein